MSFTQVNWLAVIVGAVINMVLGFLWYGPLFGRLWLRLIGKNPQELQSSSGLYAANALGALVSALVLALVIRGLGIETWWSGALAGAVLWVGLGATGTLTTNLFEGRNTGVWQLHALYQLVVFAIEGAMFAAWR
jgi:hypothetical protein